MRFFLFFIIIFSISAQIFSENVLTSANSENPTIEKITEAEKIVKSRKINKTSEDPVGIIPINFEKLKIEKQTDEFFISSDEHPSLAKFVNSLKDKGLDNIFSINFNYFILNFHKHVFGFALHYENKLNDFFSLRTKFSLETQNISDLNLNSIIYDLSLFGFFYPFCKGLEFLYAGAGFGLNYITYSGSNSIYSGLNDIGLSIIPSVGWKQYLTKNFMIDFSFGYKFLFSQTENYYENLKYLNSGFQFNIGFQIMWNRLIGKFIKDFVFNEDF